MKSEPGDFSFMKSIIWQNNLTDAYRAVSIVGPDAWDALKNHDPKQSFLFETRGPIWNQIINEMTLSHFGASYGITMRYMERIAKEGWDEFVTAYR